MAEPQFRLMCACSHFAITYRTKDVLRQIKTNFRSGQNVFVESCLCVLFCNQFYARFVCGFMFFVWGVPWTAQFCVFAKVHLHTVSKLGKMRLHPSAPPKWVVGGIIIIIIIIEFDTHLQTQMRCNLCGCCCCLFVCWRQLFVIFSNISGCGVWIWVLCFFNCFCFI